MKKLWLFLAVSFCFISSTYATSIDYKDTGYYFKVNGEVKEVKKYFIKNKEHLYLFKKDYAEASFGDYYSLSSSFKEQDDLATIIYYGYNINKTYENYYYTQMYIWKKYFNLDVSMCDREGTEVEEEEEIYNNLQNMINKHNEVEDFFTTKVRKEIWTTSDFNFYNDIEMQVPEISLNVQKNNNGITIYNDKVGNYTFELISSYFPYISRYYKESEYYFFSSQGPSLKRGTVQYEVYGTPFKIEEELVGPNGKLGDVPYGNNSYELYLNNGYKLSVSPNEEEYVKSEENYILKGGFNPFLEDFNNLSFYVGNEDNYILKIKRYLKMQKVNLNILDNNSYYIYLKSNNELYYVVNKDLKEVYLPFGEYYLKNKEGDYNISFNATLEEDINLEINNPSKEVVKGSREKEEKEEIKEEEIKEVEERQENPKEEVNNEILKEKFINPQTLDNISLYFLTLILSLGFLSSIIGYLVYCKHMSNHVNLTK